MKIVYKVYSLIYNNNNESVDNHILDFYNKFNTKEEALEYIGSLSLNELPLGVTILEVYVND